MRYFISGHRDLTGEEFNKYYVPVLDKIIEEDRNCKFVVGDYEGVDRMAQEYLALKCPEKVTVYHMFEAPRNLATGLKTKGGYKSDEARDAAMTEDSDFDIAFVKPGRRNSGTAQNLVRRKEIKE